MFARISRNLQCNSSSNNNTRDVNEFVDRKNYAQSLNSVRNVENSHSLNLLQLPLDGTPDKLPVNEEIMDKLPYEEILVKLPESEEVISDELSVKETLNVLQDRSVDLEVNKTNKVLCMPIVEGRIIRKRKLTDNTNHKYLFSFSSLRMSEPTGDSHVSAESTEPRSAKRRLPAEENTVGQPNEETGGPSNPEIGEPSNPKSLRIDDDRFEIVEQLQNENAWDLPGQMAEYANRHTNLFIQNQYIKEAIMTYNPIPTNVNLTRDIDPVVRDLLMEGDKRICLSKDHQLSSIQQRVSFIFGPLSRLWAAMEEEKRMILQSEADEATKENIKAMSQLFDQTIMLTGQAFNSCSYWRRHNILMELMNDRKRVECVLKDMAESFQSTETLLFGSKYEDTVGRHLSSKTKQKELYGTLKKATRGQRGIRPFSRSPHHNARGRGRGVFTGASSHFRGSYRGNRGGTRGGNRGKKTTNYTACTCHGRTSFTTGFSSCSPTDPKTVPRSNSKFSNSWEVDPFFEQLEVIDKRSVDFRHSAGIRNSLSIISSPKSTSCSTKSEWRGEKSGSERGSGNVGKGSHSESVRYSRPIFEQPIFSGQKRWRSPSSDKPETLEPTCSVQPLQDGRPPSIEGPPLSGRLSLQNRPEGRILCSTTSKEVTKIYSISLGGTIVRISLPMFWSFPGTLGFYKTSESPNVTFEKTQCTDHNISRRYVTDGSVSRGTSDCTRYIDFSLAKSRVCNQQAKISFGTHTVSCISGGRHRHSADDYISSERKGYTNSGSLSEDIDSPNCLNKGPFKVSGKAVLSSNSSVTCPSPVSVSATSDDQSIDRSQLLRPFSSSVKICQTGAPMVDWKPGITQWEAPSDGSTTGSDLLRCLKGGVGSILPREQNRGSMVVSGEGPTHKHSGVKSSRLGSAHFHNGETEGDFSFNANRQYDCSSLPHKNGGHEKPGISRDQQKNLGLYNGSTDHNYGRIHSYKHECGSRLAVQANKGLQRMEAAHTGIPGVVLEDENSRNRSLCFKSIQSVTKIHFLEKGSRQPGMRCVPNKLERDIHIRFPSFCSDRQGDQKVKGRSGEMILVTPAWQTQAWFPVLLGLLVQNPILLPHRMDLLQNPKGELHPLVLNRSLKLVAWRVSGKSWRQREYQEQLPRLSQLHEDQAQINITTRLGENGLAGVIRNKFVPLEVL